MQDFSYIGKAAEEVRKETNKKWEYPDSVKPNVKVKESPMIWRHQYQIHQVELKIIKNPFGDQKDTLFVSVPGFHEEFYDKAEIDMQLRRTMYFGHPFGLKQLIFDHLVNTGQFPYPCLESTFSL